MAFISRYFGHPLVILAISLAGATGLLGYSGTGPIDQVVPEENPISLAMRGELVALTDSPLSATVSGVDLFKVNNRVDLFAEQLRAAEEILRGGPVPEPEPERPKPTKPTITVHRVAKGENLSTIAKEYGIDVNTILGANNLDDINTIRIGQELRVLSEIGVLHTIKSGENLWEIARKYKVSIDDIIAANGIEEPGRLIVGQEIFIPRGVPEKDLNYYRAQQGPQFIWPVKGRISSRYGQRWGSMHHGIDIAVPTGTRVAAAAAGKVTTAGYSSSYGYLVVIDHGNGYETRYAHNSKLLVKAGQRVTQGQIIALSGNTGRSTGPHLHFEIRYKNASRDPLQYLK